VHQKELEMQGDELHRVHVALEALCAHYIELNKFSSVGYLTLTEEGVITESNLIAEVLLGKARKKFLNQPFEQFIADEYRDLWCRHFLYAKQNSGTQDCELLFRQENGKTIYFHLDCLYLKPDNAPPTMRIAFTDITFRKQTEENLHILEVAFETQAGIIVTDAHKVILRVNKAFTRITGYNAEEVMGKKPRFLRSGLHDVDFYKTLWADVATHGFWQGEIWDKRKHGEIFSTWQTISLVIGAEGAITNYVSTLTDDTPHRNNESILLEAKKCLESEVEAQKMELEKVKTELEQNKIALSVLLNHMDRDKSNAQLVFAEEVEATLVPLLKKMRTVSSGRFQTIRLTNTLEANLLQLVKSYGLAANLNFAFKQLTPMERQVAAMIRQGIASKVIAATLNVSTATIQVHRKHIRKKLGLENEVNLHSYLQSLND
jgi:PAS domain S-box-containing protein